MAGTVVLLAVLVLHALALAARAGTEGVLPSSPSELESLIVTEFPGSSACVLLLHTRGQSGCYGTAEKVPLRYYVDASGDGSDGSAVLVIEEAELPKFLEEYYHDENSALSGTVRGGLVVRGKRPAAFSPASTFPHSNFAPYADRRYEWNPPGLDALRTTRALPPLYVLTEGESEAFRDRAEWNKDMRYKYPQYVADLSTEMLAAKDANSFECLDRGNCLPIGGYSVAATLPPDPAPSADQPKDCVLVLAQIGDSNIFHGLNKGSESSLSGMIAAAAAFEALAIALTGQEGLKRRLAFGFVGSEGYGLAGSRRMMHSLRNESYALGDCSLSDITDIVEVGSVGLAKSSRDYFAHQTASRARQSEGSLFDFFVAAASDAGVSVAKPVGTPGIPPSSLMSFQNVSFPNGKIGSIPGLVLTDYSERMRNKYLSSYMDDGKNTNVSSVLSAAELLARALYKIAHNSTDAKMALDSTLLNATVSGLSACLLTPKPGMQCHLVQEVADSYLTSASLYPGVMAADYVNKQSPNDKTDFVRFLWSFLATRSEGLRAIDQVDALPQCDFPSGKLKCPSPQTQHCARWRSRSKGPNGRCVRSSVQYIPAWSHLLTYTYSTKMGLWRWGINATAGQDLKDEIWTESFWPMDTPSARVYLTEGYTYELVLFLFGAVLTVGWFWAMKCANLRIAKQMKQW